MSRTDPTNDIDKFSERERVPKRERERAEKNPYLFGARFVWTLKNE